MRALSMMLALVGSALAAGCAAEPSFTEPDAAHLELGTGTWRFEPLDDGAEVPMVKGAQGGWHVWIAVRAHGLDTGTGSMELELQPADESEPAERTRTGIRFDPPAAEGHRDSLAHAAIFLDPACAVGELLRVRVVLTTASGERLEAEREIVPTAGEHPPPACVP